MPPLTLTPRELRVFADLSRPPREVMPPPSQGGRKPGQRVAGWSKHGVKGVYQQPSGRWTARVRTGGRLVTLGTRDTLDEAAELVRMHEEGTR